MPYYTMSFFCEKNNVDLSEKTDEELESIRTELSEQKVNVSSKRCKSMGIVRSCDIQLKNIDKDLAIILKETKRRQDIEEAKNTISEDIKNIEGFTLLTEEEISIIFSKMEKRDYRKYGRYPRYLDLEKICNEVINMKKRYPKWILTDLRKVFQYDTLPPQSEYQYGYKDEEGYNFDIGGLKSV